MNPSAQKYSPKHAASLKVQSGSLETVLGKPFKIFTKYVKLFDLYFVATAKSSANSLLHGARVLYQYIDNKGTGKPDNIKVYEELEKCKATMVMFSNQKELEKNINFFEEAEKLNMVVQDLESDEVWPGSKDPKKFDASLEECFHLVTAGYCKAYPQIFGSEEGSKLAECCDRARGGHFEKVPKNYPDGAWFTYYDKTCCFDCMCTEYIYWAMTSILGAQEYRRKYIEHEWRLCSCEEVKEHDPHIYNLLTDPEYIFPKRLPVPIQEDKSVDIVDMK